jgi:hypothetical protein
MHRPFTRRQSAQNRRFLEALRRTGNARLAARELGVNRSTFTKRRAKHPAFAAAWEAALAFADTRFRDSGGEHPPIPPRNGEGDRVKRGGGAARRAEGLRTTGGEPTVVRTASGRLQLRHAPPGRMTEAAEQLFFEALGDTANFRLAAAGIGLAPPTLIARKRRHPDFAREVEETVAEAGPRIMEQARRALDTVTDEIEESICADPCWWKGLTIAEALNFLGSPPLNLVGSRSSKRG